MKIVIAISGGLDSTVMYYFLKKQGNEMIPVHFNYLSNQQESEMKSVKKVIDQEPIDIELSYHWTNSGMLNNRIKDGTYSKETLSSAYVPFRNGIIVSYLTAIAEEKGDAVAIGVHGADHEVYPDCSVDFYWPMSNAVRAGTNKRIVLLVPFIGMEKANIIVEAKKIGIQHLLHETYSCYNGGVLHCGRCPACIERMQSFKRAGVQDKTIYEEVK